MLSGSAGRADGAELVYASVFRAIQQRRPIAAVYHEQPRLFCPHRLGRNSRGELRVLCYQYGGESRSGLGPPGSSDNWRCIALERLSGVGLLNGPWQKAPSHSRPASCIIDPDVDAEDYPERSPQKGSAVAIRADSGRWLLSGWRFILSQSGLRSLVVNWFASHPAEPIAGAVVSNALLIVNLRELKYSFEK